MNTDFRFVWIFFGLADESQNLIMKDIPTFFSTQKKQKVGAEGNFLTKCTEGEKPQITQMNTDFRFARIFLDKPKNPQPHTMKDIPTFFQLRLCKKWVRKKAERPEEDSQREKITWK
jgi:hypothetical protein